MAETTDALKELTKRVQTLETTPASPAPAQMQVVEKTQDGPSFDQLAADNPDLAAVALIKAAQRMPQTAFLRGK